MDVAQVHKPNSLEHLRPNRFPGSRPSSAASTRSYTSSGSRRPQSAYPRTRTPMSTASNYTVKSATRKMIEGDEGPPMVGVTTYPYTRGQREYLEDFQSLVANTIDHPFMATTAANTASSPHDILYGSNFDDDRLGPGKKWMSEYKLSYPIKSYVESKQAMSSGVRSEQFQFLG